MTTPLLPTIQALTALDDAGLPADEGLRELAHKVVDRES
jgi:hypothetical protein